MSLRMTAVGTYMRATEASAFATEAAGIAFLERRSGVANLHAA